MTTHIEIDLEDDSLLIAEKGCTGNRYNLEEHAGQTLVENICDSLRDYLLYECEIDPSDPYAKNVKEEDEMAVTAFPTLNDYVNKFELQDFDPKFYRKPNLVSVKIDRQNELGFCSNLIVDMVTNGAMDSEIRDIIMYSMVILDAEKECLDWKKAAEDFHVKYLYEKYGRDRQAAWKNWQKDIAERLEHRENKLAERAELRAQIKNRKDKGMSFVDIAKEFGIPESTARNLIKDIEPKHDPVNHPSHYTDGRIEVIDFIEDKRLGFHLGNAVKYISRAGKKDPSKEIEDLEKAQWYLNRYIQYLKDCWEHESDICGYPPKSRHDMPGDPDGD